MAAQDSMLKVGGGMAGTQQACVWNGLSKQKLSTCSEGKGRWEIRGTVEALWVGVSILRLLTTTRDGGRLVLDWAERDHSAKPGWPPRCKVLQEPLNALCIHASRFQPMHSNQVGPSSQHRHSGLQCK